MVSDLLEKRREQVFPKLTAAQIARLQAHGVHIETRAGEVLVDPGDRHRDLLVVLSGSLEIALPGMVSEELLTVLLPGDFAGEISTLRGVAGLARIRVRESGSVLAITEESLRDLVQTDAELSEIFMRAFILRRVGLLSSGQSELMLLNTGWLKGCVELDDKAFVRTGSDLRAGDLTAAGWPLPRAPHLLETSLPGVFAVGDVRSGSVKRIASAVGEGSICVQFVHRALREVAPASA